MSATVAPQEESSSSTTDIDYDTLLADIPDTDSDDPAWWLPSEPERPLLAVAETKYVSGFDLGQAWVWPSRGKNCDGVSDALVVTELTPALEMPWETDAHAVPYIVFHRETNRLLARQPRLNKGALSVLRALGFDVCVTAQLADYDCPEHTLLTVEHLKTTVPALRHPLLQGCIVYTTRAGFRVVRVPHRWLSPEEHERSLALWLDQVAKQTGLQLDEKCRDWTRFFRLPRVVREGTTKPTTPSGIWTWRPVEIEIPPAPAPPKPGRLDRLAANVRQQLPRSNIVERARAYIDAIPTPACGTQSCERTTFKIAAKLVDKGLAFEEALPLLQAWVSRGEHKWKPNLLERKLRDAIRRVGR